MTQARHHCGFTLLRHRRLASGRVFDVHEETWRAPDGTRFTRQNILHPGAVAVLAFSAPDRVLLVRQFRAAVRRRLLEIPAGTLEPGETPLACARRELIEEVGFAARRWRKLGAVYTAPGFCTEVIHLYRAWDLRPAQAEQDDDEQIEMVEMTLREVRAAVRSGRLRDSKSLSALFLAGVLG